MYRPCAINSLAPSSRRVVKMELISLSAVATDGQTVWPVPVDLLVAPVAFVVAVWHPSSRWCP